MGVHGCKLSLMIQEVAAARIQVYEITNAQSTERQCEGHVPVTVTKSSDRINLRVANTRGC